MEINKERGGLAYWKQIIILMCSGWVTIWIYRAALSPVYPQINESLGGNISDTALGSIASFYFFGYVIMQIPAGFLVDKIGKKTVLLPGFVVFALAALLISQASSISMIYTGSFLAGIGCGSFYGSAYSLTSQNIPKEKKSFSTAIVNSGSAVGSGFGMILSSFIVIQMNMPWQTMMYLSAFLIVCMTIAFALVIRSNKEDVAFLESQAAAEEETTDQPKEKVSLSTLFSLRMLFTYVLYFATCYAYYMTVTWLPNFLGTERGFQGVAIGFSSSLVAFASIPGALFFSRLADKYMHKKVTFIVILEILAALMLLVTVQATNSTFLMIALILYGFLGKLAVEPIIISWLGENAPKVGVGTTLGVFNFFGMMSSVIAPTLTGSISDATGSKVMGFYIAIILLIGGTFLFLTVNSKKTAK
ncbi:MULTISPECIES: MFS transporter [Enterococcus]|jgi:MFS family permease|uniref:MFS transporter n=1 Tax=Enterococcus entomosocium TaxID=3034352 RepID=A0ABV3M9Y0_9ENTE|nr:MULTISPECIES: MFS transporter [Enterococcus]EPH59603.1 transporter, major facilitator family protein [Enterococcus faecium 13.SD.W.09]OTO95775.1 major facilitator family transporter [Enterococcus faecium]AUJ86330.1 MFS transporter [Enterococcus sp. CR-Ec1]MBO1122567.1 MFS transporter [Enterococcus casseliflavus]MDB1707784.1 MFS transporter [Enterococcus casseliflavus]